MPDATDIVEKNLELYREATYPRYCSECCGDVSSLPGIELFHCTKCNSHATEGPHDCYYCGGEMIEAGYEKGDAQIYDEKKNFNWCPKCERYTGAFPEIVLGFCTACHTDLIEKEAEVET
jgi:hypothetical protein